MAKRQLTLGELIGKLKSQDQDEIIRFDFAYLRPTGIHSWRGDYSQLAIGWTSENKDMKVSELLKLCEDADGKDFQGWKGGDFTMDYGTPVWVANPNESANTAIVDVTEETYVIIHTAYQNY